MTLTECYYEFTVAGNNFDHLKKKARAIADEVLGPGAVISSFRMSQRRKTSHPGSFLYVADVTAGKQDVL